MLSLLLEDEQWPKGLLRDNWASAPVCLFSSIVPYLSFETFVSHDSNFWNLISRVGGRFCLGILMGCDIICSRVLWLLRPKNALNCLLSNQWPPSMEFHSKEIPRSWEVVAPYLQSLTPQSSASFNALFRCRNNFIHNKVLLIFHPLVFFPFVRLAGFSEHFSSFMNESWQKQTCLLFHECFDVCLMDWVTLTRFF